jgi:hypothetical protein
MSTPVAYVAEAVIVQYLDGATWTTLDAASVTLNQSYDVSERGILVPGTDTCELALSMWVDDTIDVLGQGSVVRLKYVQPGTDELYRGVVTDVTVNYTAAPAAARHGHAWRADFQLSTTSLAASRLAVTVSWSTLPAETVSARLGRWIDDVDLMGITDPLMPAETSQGSTTLLEMVRAACDYLGRPVRLINSGTETAIQVVTSGASLPTGYTEADALDMYSRASVQTSAGERILSFDTDDASLAVAADLVNDDVRVLFSSWRIPDPLPAPFNDAAPVQSFTMTFTPDGCTGSLGFSYDTPHVLRYRPPAPYVPGEPSTTVGNGGSNGSTGGSGGTGGGSGTGTVIGQYATDLAGGVIMLGQLDLALSPQTWHFSGSVQVTLTSGSESGLAVTSTTLSAIGLTATASTPGEGYDKGTLSIESANGGMVNKYGMFFIGYDNPVTVEIAFSGEVSGSGNVNIIAFSPNGGQQALVMGGTTWTLLDTDPGTQP